jgi:uncharacterized membrane protein YozB (DUF420 family)
MTAPVASPSIDFLPTRGPTMNEMLAAHEGLKEGPIAARAVRHRNNFALGMAGLMVLITFVGFAPSFYLRAQFGRPAMPSLTLAHGVVYSVWMLLFIMQAALIRTGKTTWHRRLGIAGACLAFAMVFLTVAAQMGNTHRLVAAGLLEQQALFVNSLAVSGVLNTLTFGGLVAAAVALRRRPQTHRSLMLLAAISLMSAPLVRIMTNLSLPTPATFIGMDMLILAVAMNDLRVQRRVHPATLWGSVPLLGFQALTYTPFFGSAAVTAYSRWLASFGV